MTSIRKNAVTRKKSLMRQGFLESEVNKWIVCPSGKRQRARQENSQEKPRVCKRESDLL
jgi:hypothetical protein